MSDSNKSFSSGARREVSARNTSWARLMSARMAKAGVRPNAISWFSVFFSLGAGLAAGYSGFTTPLRTSALMLLAATLTGLRVLCNLFDGMVAVEGGLGTKSGEIFNDLPDRISDTLILVGAGYAVNELRFGVELGWTAAVLSVIVAYCRTLAGAVGATPRFLGPMAKQHRIAIISTAFIIHAAVFRSDYRLYFVATALGIISTGSIVTIVRRIHAAVSELENQ